MDNVQSIITFRTLGTLESRYYYYSFLLQRIVALTPLEHKKENLFNLAPLSHWKIKNGDKRDGVMWDAAVDSLMQTCAADGLFNPNNVIGRGIWIIEGKGITHYGDKILIDSKKYDPKQVTREIGGRKIYEASEPLQLGVPDVTSDFTQIKTILSQLHFETPHAALLLSGQIVCAMAAGALPWRPHSWITGKSGSGKSAVMTAILRLLGNCTEHYVGETTEAGIRQDLKHDCRAVVFDEAEPKNHTAQQKIQGVLNLLRQASSSETGKIAKGTTTGKGMNFRIRSCGILASCNAQLTEEADRNRFLVVKMASPMEKKEFNKWKFKMENIFTKGFQAALHSHISENILTLASNAEIFASVLGERFNDNRAGDQYGALIAGAFLLNSTEMVTKESASAWLMSIKRLPPEIEDIQDNSDASFLWNYIKQRMVRFQKENTNNYGNKNYVYFDRPIEELIDVAFGNYTPTTYAKGDAEQALADKGIKTIVENGIQYVGISTNHTAIGDMIKGCRFAGLDWSPILRNLEGALVGRKAYRIGNKGIPSKVTLIKWEFVTDETLESYNKVTELNIDFNR